MAAEAIAEAVTGVHQLVEVSAAVVADSVEAVLAVAECVAADVVNCQMYLYVVQYKEAAMLATSLYYSCFTIRTN
jgi:hypothetical protein